MLRICVFLLLALAAPAGAVVGGEPVDDAAIIQLDRPVVGVTPAAVHAPGAPMPRDLHILGYGRQRAGIVTGGGGLMAAPLRAMSDDDCARKWRRRSGNGGERFDPARM